MPDEDWGVPDVCLQKTAEVMYIMEMKNCRAAMGQLKVMTDGNRNWALFSPTDSRMPRMMIPADQLPSGFFERPQVTVLNLHDIIHVEPGEGVKTLSFPESGENRVTHEIYDVVRASSSKEKN
ncbi:unnamed protein product [Strongylus vulgaris]|uniref:CSD2 domain-containing protein n=1 Tax=Strongylus vulgaris TaxID=40348 RepID=A0A3P7ITL1_STRVU|nr:unnamed protein product [Strongylus vulgaris]